MGLAYNMENEPEYTDKYEKSGIELIGKLTKTNIRKNAIVFREIANQFKKSAHPQADDIFNMMYGMSKQCEGKAETAAPTAILLFD